MEKEVFKVLRHFRKFTLQEIVIYTGKDKASIQEYLDKLEAYRIIVKSGDHYTLLNEKAYFAPITDDDFLNLAPSWARLKVRTYFNILKRAGHKKGKELRKYIYQWNYTHPKEKTSYSSIMNAKKILRTQGVSGLIPKYAHNAGQSVVKINYFEKFKEFYLTKENLSVRACIEKVREYFEVEANDYFPANSSFIRRLKREVPKEQIDFCRKYEL